MVNLSENPPPFVGQTKFSLCPRNYICNKIHTYNYKYIHINIHIDCEQCTFWDTEKSEEKICNIDKTTNFFVRFTAAEKKTQTDQSMCKNV